MTESAEVVYYQPGSKDFLRCRCGHKFLWDRERTFLDWWNGSDCGSKCPSCGSQLYGQLKKREREFFEGDW